MKEKLATGPRIDHENKIIGGVCAGFAKYFGIDTFWVRLIAVIALVSSAGTAALVYLLLWLFMDDEPVK